jgi:hypothetical protein
MEDIIRERRAGFPVIPFRAVVTTLRFLPSFAAPSFPDQHVCHVFSVIRIFVYTDIYVYSFAWIKKI